MGSTPNSSSVAIGIELVKDSIQHQTGWPIHQLTMLPPDRARVSPAITIRVLDRSVTIAPSVDIRFTVADGRVGVTVERVMLFGVPVPRGLIEEELRDRQQLVEEQMSSIIALVQSTTTFRLVGVSVTSDTLVLDFRP